MKFPFSEQPYEIYPNFKGGEKALDAKMTSDGMNRIISGKLVPGATIGMHTHETNSEVIYILSGEAKVYYDDGVDICKAGDVHYCPKGHTHSLTNNSTTEELTFFAVVPEQ